jgi:hypothetical protein
MSNSYKKGGNINIRAFISILSLFYFWKENKMLYAEWHAFFSQSCPNVIKNSSFPILQANK